MILAVPFASSGFAATALSRRIEAQVHSTSSFNDTKITACDIDGDGKDELLPTVPRCPVESIRSARRHDWLGPPSAECLRRRLGMPFGPAFEQRDPLRSRIGSQLDTNISDADVAVGIEPVSRRVPELQVLREV